MVQPLEFQRMITPSQVDLNNLGGMNPLPGGEKNPRIEDVAIFNRFMSGNPTVTQSNGTTSGNGTGQTSKLDQAIKEFTKTMKTELGTTEFNRRKNAAFPNGATDEQYGKFIYMIIQATITNIGQLNKSFEADLKDNAL